VSVRSKGGGGTFVLCAVELCVLLGVGSCEGAVIVIVIMAIFPWLVHSQEAVRPPGPLLNAIWR